MSRCCSICWTVILPIYESILPTNWFFLVIIQSLYLFSSLLSTSSYTTTRFFSFPVLPSLYNLLLSSNSHSTIVIIVYFWCWHFPAYLVLSLSHYWLCCSILEVISSDRVIIELVINRIILGSSCFCDISGCFSLCRLLDQPHDVVNTLVVDFDLSFEHVEDWSMKRYCSFSLWT